MQTLKGLWKITRPLSTVSGLFATGLGGYVAGTGEWNKIILAMLVTGLVGGAANAWNDYLDVEIDRINQPNRVLPSGQLSPKLAWQFSIVASLIALFISFFINLPAFLITLVCVSTLYFYSWKLKSTVLMGNITIACLSAISAILGGVAAGNVAPTLWLAAIIGCGIFGREVLKTIADYEGDLSQDCRTISTVFGKRVARVLFYALALATLWVMLIPYIFQVYTQTYLIIVLFGVFPVLVYVFMQVSPTASGQHLERLSTIMKYDFLVWFAAVILGSSI